VELLILVCLLSTSLVLFAAGVEHVAGRAKLRSRMLTHQVLGPRGVTLASVGLSVLELVVATGSLWFVATSSRSGLGAALLLQTVLFWSFAGYLVMVVRAGNAGVPCGCGPAEVPVGRSAIARAIGLGILSCASAVSVSAFDLESLTIRANASGLLACAASFTLAILLVILAPARRLEPLTGPRNVPETGGPSNPGKTPRQTMIGSA
jgi:hypothetical protein